MRYRYSVAIPEQGGKFLHRPIVEIEIFGPKGKMKDTALIDSGADRSLFNVEIAAFLGIDIAHASARTAIGISGSSRVYIADVEIKLRGAAEKIRIPAGFINSPYVGVLLGQDGFFDAHRILFQKHRTEFEIKPIRKKRR